MSYNFEAKDLRAAGAWLQSAIASAVAGDFSPQGVETVEAGAFVRFSVPGFGTYKVLNNPDRLEKFAKKLKRGAKGHTGGAHPCFSPKRRAPEEAPRVSTRRVPISAKKWDAWAKDGDVWVGG